MNVPSVAGALENVTVSPITNPFVLPMVKFKGFVDVAPVVTFPVTDAFEISVPIGIAAYGQLPMVREEFVMTEATLNVPNPEIFTGKFVPENPLVFANGMVRAVGVNRVDVTVFCVTAVGRLVGKVPLYKTVTAFPETLKTFEVPKVVWDGVKVTF